MVIAPCKACEASSPRSPPRCILGTRFVYSDMWRQYLNVIAEQIPAALHVLDRFHIMRNMTMALDKVRRAEVAQLRPDGYEPILTKARWCLLKRPENLTEHQEVHPAVQPQERPGSSAPRGLPAVLGVHEPRVGHEVPRCLVHTLIVNPDRPDEEDRPEPAASSATDPQLVPGSRHHLVGHCRGIQRQSKTDHQKSVWLQDAAGHRNRPLSHARPITGAPVHPQILLRRLFFPRACRGYNGPAGECVSGFLLSSEQVISRVRCHAHGGKQ